MNLAKALKIVQSTEAATQEAILLWSGTKEDSIQINYVAHRSKPPSKPNNCYQCGAADGHSPSECGAMNSKCNACKKVRHLQKVCRSMTKTAGQNWHKQWERPAKKDKEHGFYKICSLKTKSWLLNNSDDENEPMLFFHNSDSSITVQLNDQRTRMIVNTGCTTSYPPNCINRSLRTMNRILLKDTLQHMDRKIH